MLLSQLLLLRYTKVFSEFVGNINTYGLKEEIKKVPTKLKVARDGDWTGSSSESVRRDVGKELRILCTGVS